MLSGPAGGVVGYAMTMREEEEGPVIGFNMGSTSTDVSRLMEIMSTCLRTLQPVWLYKHLRNMLLFLSPNSVLLFALLRHQLACMIYSFHPRISNKHKYLTLAFCLKIHQSCSFTLTSLVPSTNTPIIKSFLLVYPPVGYQQLLEAAVVMYQILVFCLKMLSNINNHFTSPFY